MRILLDECVDQRLRLSFTGHDCHTSGYAKLSGLKNGVLLAAAESAGFDVLLTTDQEIPYQQNLAMRRIALVILCAPTNRLADLQPLAPGMSRLVYGAGVLVAADRGAAPSRSISRRCWNIGG